MLGKWWCSVSPTIPQPAPSSSTWRFFCCRSFPKTGRWDPDVFVVEMGETV